MTKNSECFSQQLIQTLDNYLNTLQQEKATNLHEMVISQVEKPLIEFILEKSDGNQSKAASMLGINRNTLRKKIQQYQITLPE